MKIRLVLKALLALVIAVVVACAALFAWMKVAPRRVPDGQPSLATLSHESLPVFRDSFNAGGGEVRILALLSPT